jgi:hypothetical protein
MPAPVALPHKPRVNGGTGNVMEIVHLAPTVLVNKALAAEGGKSAMVVVAVVAVIVFRVAVAIAVAVHVGVSISVEIDVEVEIVVAVTPTGGGAPTTRLA